ncbi:hypothetical protein DVS28_b0574 (plasmid) [Euzebya pacifica]|uniref:ParB-like N-terminal domain-containing protein n=1 Tax=Euzebya pacifica TaxID=1608957 RepID=A0A346Y767_9ACTN|nr:ParB N-terminal domain-containing protein [Euzebya pacifica]AXV10314.1 hypothetical protein DVS28_b0574 [Euzebya pacifica]
MSTLTAPEETVETDRVDETIDLLSRLDTSDRFKSMELRDLPVLGKGAPRVNPQVRPAQAHALTREGVDELIQSMRFIGQLQPVIVEELPDGTLQLIAGQRRMNALEFAHAEEIDSRHFNGTMKALVFPGPLSEWELWAVQLAENIKRKDLTATDVGRALWMARCKLLVERVTAQDQEVPDEIMGISNPADRCVALFEWKDSIAGLGTTGANWLDTAEALGLDMSEPTAKAKAKQFRDLGETLSAKLDGQGASHRARKAAAEVTAASGQDAADEILTAIEQFGEDGADSRLVEEAMLLRRDNPEMGADEIVNQVAAERGMAERLEPDRPLGVLDRVEEIEPDDEVADPDPVDADALIRRLRDIDNGLSEKVEPHIRTVSGQVANGAPVSSRDAATLLMLAGNLEGFAGRIRALAQCEE